MAEFHIKKQQAQVIQQADVINTDILLTWEGMSERLQSLLPQVADIVAAGELDEQVGAGLHVAISEAVVAPEKTGRLRALRKASNIALGVTILSGISQTISEIISLLSR